MEKFKLKDNYSIESYSFFEEEEYVSYASNILKLVRLFNKNGINLKYGLFDDSYEKAESVLKKIQLNIIYLNNEIVGYQYFYLLNNKSIHLGLVNISVNTGFPILYISGILGTTILYKKIGKMYLTTITTIPKVAESVDFTFDGMWPSPYRSLSRSPKEYRVVVNNLKNDYVFNVFPNEKEIIVDEKRFILKMNSKRESGFDDQYYKLPRASKIEYNLLCKSWINYENDEDMIMVGKYNLKTYIKLLLFIGFFKLKYSLVKLR